MRYFTPELMTRLNSPDPDVVDRAMAEWEARAATYRSSLDAVRVRMTPQARAITLTSLHDWNLVDIKCDAAAPTRFAHIVLKYQAHVTVLRYALTGGLQRFGSPKERWQSATHVDWLYDEVDLDHDRDGSFVHRILFSDGTILLVPFSDCEITQAKLDHVMSHADLLRVA